MRLFFICTLLFLVSSNAQAQCPSWQTNLNQFGPVGAHYQDLNIEETLDGTGDFIVTGAKFDTGFNSQQLFAARIEGSTGSRIWVQDYTGISAARGFDVVTYVDMAGAERFAITGYVNDNGALNKTFIAVFNSSNGAILQDEAFVINPAFHSQGLNIIYTNKEFNGVVTPGFVVAGYSTGNYDPLIANDTEGFVLRTDANLNPLFTTITSSPTAATNDYDMANEVAETSDGFFITGSVNQDTGAQQGVLAMKLNEQGAIQWQNNYIFGNNRDKGVDAFYDAATNQIFLLTYYSVTHYFGVTVFNNGNGAINPIRSYVYQNPNELNVTGFKIMPSNNLSFPNDLLIMGYARDGTIVEPNGTTLQGNSVPFSISIDRFSGAVNRYKTYPIPYKDPANYLDIFRFWDGQSPLIFHPEIGFPLSNGGCYTMVGRRSYGSYRTAIETFTLDLNQTNVCVIDDLIINLVPFSMTTETLTTTNTTATINPITFTAQNNGSETQDCQEGGTLASADFNLNNIQLFPNPASEILRVGNLLTSDARYAIHNITGKQVHSGSIFNNEITVSQLKSGVYFVSISEENNITIKKFIKK